MKYLPKLNSLTGSPLGSIVLFKLLSEDKTFVRTFEPHPSCKTSWFEQVGLHRDEFLTSIKTFSTKVVSKETATKLLKSKDLEHCLLYYTDEKNFTHWIVNVQALEENIKAVYEPKEPKSVSPDSLYRKEKIQEVFNLWKEVASQPEHLVIDTEHKKFIGAVFYARDGEKGDLTTVQFIDKKVLDCRLVLATALHDLRTKKQIIFNLNFKSIFNRYNFQRLLRKAKYEKIEPYGITTVDTTNDGESSSDPYAKDRFF